MGRERTQPEQVRWDTCYCNSVLIKDKEITYAKKLAIQYTQQVQMGFLTLEASNVCLCSWSLWSIADLFSEKFD